MQLSSSMKPMFLASSSRALGSLLRETVSPRCRVKASGKINTYERAVAVLDAGADLIGTSSALNVLQRTEGSTAAY